MCVCCLYVCSVNMCVEVIVHVEAGMVSGLLLRGLSLHCYVFEKLLSLANDLQAHLSLSPYFLPKAKATTTCRHDWLYSQTLIFSVYKMLVLFSLVDWLKKHAQFAMEILEL